MAAAAILDLQLKMAQEHKNYHFIILVMPDLVEIDTLFTIFGHLVQDIRFIVFFQDGVGGHLGFKGQGGSAC